MLKTALSVALTLILALSCAGRPYDYLHGPPRLDLRDNSRFAMVGRPYYLNIILTGQMPDPDQDIMIVVKVDGVDRIRSVGYMGTSRAIPGNGQRFPLNFTELDYYSASGKLRTGVFGDPYLDPDGLDGDPFAEDAIEDAGWLYIDVELWTAEPHPTDPNLWVQARIYAKDRLKVNISCPQCTY